MRTHVLSIALAGLTVITAACGRESQSQPTPVAAVVQDTPEKKDDRPAQPKVQPPPSQVDADYVSFPGGLKAFPEKRRVEMEAHMLSEQTRALEFLLVAPGGATHESLFATVAKGEHLKRALEIIGLKEGAEKRMGRGYLEKPTGDRVKISVRFKHRETGKEAVARIEDWLWDFQREANPEPVGWVFTGSSEQYRPQLNRSLVEADLKGNLIGLWRDASCVLDNDRPNGIRSDVYSPIPKPETVGIPQSKHGVPTMVTLIFEPHE